MKLPESHQKVMDLFVRFRSAVLSGDGKAFEALCARDIAPQVGLFQTNSERLRAAKLDLKLRKIEQEGQVATASFDVVDEKGAKVDEGEVVTTEEPEGFRIRSL